MNKIILPYQGRNPGMFTLHKCSYIVKNREEALALESLELSMIS